MATKNIAAPQGSVMGPLLLYIYISIYKNDIYKATTNFAIINYADDTTFVSTVGIFDTNGQEQQY